MEILLSKSSAIRINYANCRTVNIGDNGDRSKIQANEYNNSNIILDNSNVIHFCHILRYTHGNKLGNSFSF